jgi:hypothetical protein
MEASNVIEFPPLSETLGKLHLTKKKVLIPEMNRMTAHLFAATFRSFGIEAHQARLGAARVATGSQAQVALRVVQVGDEWIAVAGEG